MADKVGETVDKIVINRVLNVDALNAAARLAGIEKSAINQILHRMADVGVGAHIGWILAAQLQPDADETPGRGGLNHFTTGNRTGEGDEVNLRILDNAFGGGMIQVQELENAGRQTGGGEGFGITLGGQRRLPRMLQDHCIPRHQRRNDRIHRCQVGVVPRRDDENHAQGLMPNEAGEAVFFLGLGIMQDVRRDGDHVPGTFLQPLDFTGGVADRPAHLPGNLFGDSVHGGDHGIDRTSANRGAFLKWDLAPYLDCAHG